MKLAALAEEGDAAAQLRLGGAYILGMGVVKDEAEGWRWCRKAAEQGGARAQVLLGGAYMRGTGVEKDEEEGLKWVMKAEGWR
jgi:TPR repeat protein